MPSLATEYPVASNGVAVPIPLEGVRNDIPDEMLTSLQLSDSENMVLLRGGLRRNDYLRDLGDLEGQAGLDPLPTGFAYFRKTGMTGGQGIPVIGTTIGWFSANGSADLIVNGDFSTALDWYGDPVGAHGWTIGTGGVAERTNISAISSLIQLVSTVVSGRSYQLKFDVTVLTSGTITPAYGATTGTAVSSAANDITWYFTAASSDQLNFKASADFAGKIDNVKLVEVYPVTMQENWVDISGSGRLTAGQSDQVVFRQFIKAGTNYLIGVNGKDANKKWAGSGDYADVGGTPEIAKTCMVIGRRLVIGNLATSGPNAVDWSDIADFETGYGNTAYLSDTPGHVVAMMERGNNSGFVYTDDAIWEMAPTADEIDFTTELRVSGIIGPASALSVIRLPDGRHMYLGRDDNVYVWDGNSVFSIGPHIAAYSEKNDLYHATGTQWATLLPRAGYAIFTVPSRSVTNRTASLWVRIADMSLWPIDYGFFFPTAGMGFYNETAREEQLWIGSYPRYDGFSTVSKTQASYNASGTVSVVDAEPSFVQTGWFDFQQPVSNKTVLEMRHFVKKLGAAGRNSMTVTVDSYDAHPGEITSTSKVVDITTATTGPIVTQHRLNGTRFRVKISFATTPSDGSPHWYGSVINVAERGKK